MALVSDKVANVRIGVARTLRNHFKTINGAFVSDHLVNNAVRVLRTDRDTEVANMVNEIRAFQDFDERSSNVSSASANTDTTEAFLELLNKSIRSSTSYDSETNEMEEEIIKASGIAIIRAAEKRLEENAKMKPEKVSMSAIQSVEKREDAHTGQQEEELSQQIS